MIRDWWTCTIVSVMFEFLEYSLEHQLPNFSECWWDHVGAGHAHWGWPTCTAQPSPLRSTLPLGGGTWGPEPPQMRQDRAEGQAAPASSPQWIMDVLVCNGLGIYCGMKTLEWLSLKTYKWQGLWNIPTYKYVLRGPGGGPWGAARLHLTRLSGGRWARVGPPATATWGLALGCPWEARQGPRLAERSTPGPCSGRGWV